MANNHSLQEVFKKYLESEQLPELNRRIAGLIAAGALSRAGFDELIASADFSVCPGLKETLLDLTLVFIHKCVQDHELSDQEMHELRTLLTVFRIEEGQLRPAAVQEILTNQVMRILEDRYVTKQEDILQKDLQRVFGLSYDQYVAVLRPLAIQCIQGLERKRLTTQNQEELQLIISSIQNLRGTFLVSI